MAEVNGKVAWDSPAIAGSRCGRNPRLQADTSMLKASSTWAEAWLIRAARASIPIRRDNPKSFTPAW